MTKYRSARLVLTVQAPFDPAPGQISNTAYVYGAEVDPDNSNNHVTTYTRIDGRQRFAGMRASIWQEDYASCNLFFCMESRS